jgi:hypothetical protein
VVTRHVFTAQERRQLVNQELAAFEKRENEFNARERKERAVQLGLISGPNEADEVASVGSQFHFLSDA